ncbi:uncharacterized protein LOC143277431 isoform X2 [Babylonia areolata]
MSKEDDCPPLVSSESDEDECQDAVDEVVEQWMQQGTDGPTMAQVLKIRSQGVGLFLLGTGSVFPEIWINALVEARTMEHKDIPRAITCLTSREQFVLELITNIFDMNKFVFFPRKAESMKQILRLVNTIERKYVQDGKINLDRTLHAAPKCMFFRSEFGRLLKMLQEPPYEERRSKENVYLPSSQFAVLFFCKLVHMHVTYYGKNKELLTTKYDRAVEKTGRMQPEKARALGNDSYNKKEYRKAIAQYTMGMETGYDNHLLFGNRAQCFRNLGEYWDALSDCRRAMFVNPAWPKGFYRAADCSLQLGDPWDEAQSFIESALCLAESSDSPDSEQLQQIKELKKKIEDFRKKPEKERLEEVARKEVEQRLKIRHGSCLCHCTCPPDLKQARIDFETLKASAKMEADKQAALESKTKADDSPGRAAERRKFELCLTEGLEAVNLNNMLRAAGKYQAAANLWNQSDSLKSATDAKKMKVVRYAFGITAVSQSDVRSLIQDGLHTFQTMWRDRLHTNFPLLLYGFTRALIAMYRFTEALEVVAVEITVAMRKAWKPVHWPMSEQAIKESDWVVFQKEMEKLREVCRLPPPPDAVCFEHVDTEEGKAIYIHSPFYGGMVVMSCYLQCRFKFHLGCWKVYKNRFSEDKISEKEVIDRDCPTPDCGSFISYISVNKPGKKVVEFVSEQRPVRASRPSCAARMKPSSQRTIARRQERKDLRRQKKAEARRATASPNSPSLHGSDREEATQEASALPQTDSMVLLLSKERKKEEECLKYNIQPELFSAASAIALRARVLSLPGINSCFMRLQADVLTNPLARISMARTLARFSQVFQKTVKQKKKKEKKEKAQIVSVEVNFTEHPDRERVGGHDYGEEEVTEVGVETATMTSDPWLNEGLYVKPVATPTDHGKGEATPPAPPPLTNPVEMFSKVVATVPPQNLSQSKKDEDIRKNLSLLFHDILQAEGPQRLQSLTSSEMFQDIPEEASRIIQQCGGLRLYFMKNSDFVVKGSVVGVSDDLHKVQQLADSIDVSSLSHFSPPTSHLKSNSSLNSNHSALLDSVDSAPRTKEAWEDRAGEVITTGVISSRQTGEYCDSSDSREMTLPTIRQGLNPSAPEFLPLQAKTSRMNDIDDIELGPYSTAVNGGGAVNIGAGPDESDNDDVQSTDRNLARCSLDVNEIDDADLEPTAGDEAATLPSGQDGMSQRSSQSDLSQAGSDVSTGMLFRTTSPSSSASSSHKAARDVGSPFSLRDTNSPSITARFSTSDFPRQSGSPGLPAGERGVVGASLVSPSPSGPSIDVDTNGRMMEDVVSGFPSVTTEEGFVPAGDLPPAPRPLKPLAPLGGSATRLLASGGVNNGGVGALTRNSGPTAVGSVSADLCGSDAVDSSSSLSPFVLSADRSAVGVAADQSASLPWSSVQSFVPSSKQGFMSTLSSFPADLSSPYSCVFPTDLAVASSVSLTTSYTPTSFTSALTSVSDTTTTRETSLLSTLTPSLPLSSAFAEEFRPLSSQRYNLPFSATPSFSSSSSAPLASTVWGATPSLVGGGDTWTNINTFPSAVRPDEPLPSAAISPDYGVPRPLPESSPQPPPSSSSTSSFGVYSWSIADDWDCGVGAGGGQRGTVEAGVQAGVGLVEGWGRTVETSTEVTGRDLAMQQSRAKELYMQNLQLCHQLEQYKLEVEQRKQEQVAAQRLADEQRNDLKKAVQQMSNLEIEYTRNASRMQEEHAVRENQLLADLQAMQQKNHLTSMETTNLLQKSAAMEERAKQEKNRAIQAELRVVQEQMENFKLMLGTKVREVEHRRQEFRMCVMNWQRNNQGQQPPDQQVKDILTYYQDLLGIFTGTLDSVMRQLKEQQEQIMVGKPLSELEPVSSIMPLLPPPPEGLKTSPTGQPIFIPSVATSRPAMSPDPSLDSSLPLPSALSQVPTPLRPPMPIARPPGISQTSGLVAASFTSPPQQTTAVEPASVRGAPPPLRPIGSVGKGLAVGGASVRPAPPLAATGADNPGGAPVKQTSFDRLVACLQKNFPSCDRELFQQCVQELRRAHSGSLSGLDLEYIVNRVTQMLVARGNRPTRGASPMKNGSAGPTTSNGSSSSWEVKRTAPPPGISPAWSVEGLDPVMGDRFVEEEDPCLICTDELSTAPTLVLDCGHRFHDQCIREWFKQQTTCPKCRSHAPLQEDFPLLK